MCSETGIESHHMGRIDLHARHAFFEVDEQVSNQVLPKIKEGIYEGKSFEVTPAQGGDKENYQGNKKKR